MSVHNDSVLKKFATALIAVEPTIPMDADEIAETIKENGLQSFIAGAGVGISELFEAIELMSGLSEKEESNGS